MLDGTTPQEGAVESGARQLDGQGPVASDRPSAGVRSTRSAAGKDLVLANRQCQATAAPSLVQEVVKIERLLAPKRKALALGFACALAPMRDALALEFTDALAPMRGALQTHQRQVEQITRLAFKPPRFVVPSMSITWPTADLPEAVDRTWMNSSLLAGFADTIRPTAFHPLTETLTALLRQMADLNRFLVSIRDSLGDLLLSLLLRDAEDARADYLAGRGLESVAEFAAGWLGFRATSAGRTILQEAVVDALLSEEWDGGSVERVTQTAHELRRHLRTGVSKARSRWKPTWEHRVAGLRVGSLNRPIVMPGGAGEVGDLVPDTIDVETLVLDRDLTSSPQLKVLADLPVAEQEVCRLVAEGWTWSSAAAAAGLPETSGRNIQAKVKRRVREALKRNLARDCTTARIVT